MPTARELPELPTEDFLDYAGLSAYVEALARSRPELCRLTSLGASREGRQLHLLSVTDLRTGAPEEKPAYLIHANIHAVEVAGTHAALTTVRRLLDDAGDPASPRHAEVLDLLGRTAFYVVPRLNPDGAEQVIRSNLQVRSRTDRSELEPNTLYQEDVDGDGMVLTMRVPHPDGELAANPLEPRLLVRRRVGTPGPYYRLYPEGLVHDWDGGERIGVEGRRLDWNRNWSCNWRPEPEQWGSGDFAFSEAEMGLFARFIASRRNLYAVLGYHTGPNAVLRPPSTGARTDIDPEDDQLMEDLAREAAKETGFPVLPVVQYHDARSRDINLYGHFHDFGYQHLGLFVQEFELGILMNSAGMKTEEIFAGRTDEESEELDRRLMAWADAHPARPPFFVPWRPFTHPQLGKVEIGGFVMRFLENPPLDELCRIADATYAFTLRHARRHPWVVVEEARAEPVGGGVVRVRARIANRGGLPTNVSNRGRSLLRLPVPRVELVLATGVELLSATGHRELGHLAALTGSSLCEWFVRAPKAAPGRSLCTLRVHGGAGGDAVREVSLPLG